MTTTPVYTIFQRAARKLGAQTGTVTSSTTTATVLGGLVNTTGSDQSFAGWRLMLPLQVAEADQQTFVTAWTDLTGTATHASITDPADGSPYILAAREDYTLQEFKNAWSEALRQGTRTYRQVIPITPNLRMQPFQQCPWLRGMGDTDAVYWNISPVALHNEDFGLWQNGSALAPDGWTLAGSGATVARVENGIRSAYSARVTRVGNDATLTQSMPQQYVQWITRRTSAVFTPIRGAAWVTCGTASVARVGVRVTEDGVQSTTWGDYHTGSSRPEFLETSVTPTAGMTEITLVLQVANSNTSADFGAAVLMQNTTAASNTYQIRDQGSQFYVEQEVRGRLRNVGGVPTLELSVWPNVPGQIIVYSRRPFPQLTDLDDEIEDEYAQVLEWGLLVWLLRNVKPQQDRARLDRIQKDAEQEWSRFLANTIDLPVGDPPNTVVIGAI